MFYGLKFILVRLKQNRDFIYIIIVLILYTCIILYIAYLMVILITADEKINWRRTGVCLMSIKLAPAHYTKSIKVT